MTRSTPASISRRTALVLTLLYVLCSDDGWAQPPAASGQTTTPPPLELVVLGSGGPGATGRAGSSYVLLLDGAPRILVDAGPGAFARIGEAKLGLTDLDVVLLTHLHVDHVGELPGLFKARAVSTRGPITFRIFGPEGRRAQGDDAGFPSTSRLMELLFGRNGAFAYLKDFSAPITLKPVDIRATTEAQPSPHKILSEGGLTITAAAGHHRDAPAIFYRVDYGGRCVTFSGDVDAAGLPGLTRIAQGCNLLVFNSVVLEPPGSPEVLYTLHSPPSAIGTVADAAGVGHLLLSHLSPAVDGARPAVQGGISARYKGPITFAEDGLRLIP